jgi:MFS family permease
MAPAEGMAMVSGIAYFGFLAGPPVIGFLADQISLRWAMLLPAFLALFIALGSYLAIQKEDA